MDIIGFFSAAILLTLMPGPDILFVITQSILRGKKAGIIFATGLCTGLIVHTTAVSLGLSLLISQSPIAFTLLKYAGATYLIYLGIQSFIQRRANSITTTATKQTEHRLYRKGILMNILNPKVLLFFIAFFPQFIDPQTPNLTTKIIILGLLFMLQAWIIFLLVALLADKLAQKLIHNQRFSLVMHLIETLVYFIIGFSLLLISQS